MTIFSRLFDGSWFRTAYSNYSGKWPSLPTIEEQKVKKISIEEHPIDKEYRELMEMKKNYNFISGYYGYLCPSAVASEMRLKEAKKVYEENLKKYLEEKRNETIQKENKV